MKCFACDGQINGSYKVIYCVPEHHTKEQLEQGTGVFGKLINLVLPGLEWVPPSRSGRRT